MGYKMGIGYSPLSESVYLGKQNREKGMWVGEKRDITQDFYGILSQWLGAGEMRELNTNSKSTVYICIENTEEGKKQLLEYLTKEVKENE